LKLLADQSPEMCVQAKLTIYATTTITHSRKNSPYFRAKSLLETLNLKRTVKDWRNSIVHSGERIDQQTYQVCKELIENSWKSFALNSDEWAMMNGTQDGM